MSFFICLYLEVDILHASFPAPCNRLYSISWSSWDREPVHRAGSREARQPQPGHSTSVPMDAYQCFQICTGSAKCLISPHHFCLQFINVNPQLVLAYPKLRQIRAERETESETERQRPRPLLNFPRTLTYTIQKEARFISACMYILFYSLGSVLFWILYFYLFPIEHGRFWFRPGHNRRGWYLERTCVMDVSVCYKVLFKRTPRRLFSVWLFCKVMLQLLLGVVSPVLCSGSSRVEMNIEISQGSVSKSLSH